MAKRIFTGVFTQKSSAALSFFARVAGEIHKVKRNVYTSAPPRFFTIAKIFIIKNPSKGFL